MPTRNLSKIFRPQSIAVVGASEEPGSVGRTLLENLHRAQFPGPIYPINPKHKSLLGLPAFPSVATLPSVPDLAVIATPAATVPVLVSECGERGTRGVIVLSAGFREVGSAGRALEAELAQSLARFPDMRLIGPNSLGVLVPGSRLNASFAAAMAAPGRIAFISQSGALCTSILDWSLSERIGFSLFVSIGNSLNVQVGDLIDYLAEDPTTDAIVLYVESITDARQFMSAARAFTRTKPIVVYKGGRFAQSAAAAASHTGAMAGVDAVYEAAFQRAGMVRVLHVEEMFDCAELLARQRTPDGPRLVVVTNAGGPGVMAIDELLGLHGEVAELAPTTVASLDAVLPPHGSHGNPVDVLGDAQPQRFADALRIVADDPQVDAVLVVLSPQAMTDPTATAKLVAEAAASTAKPILAAWMGGPAVTLGREILHHAAIPTYDSPDRAVRAFMQLVAYRRNHEILYETPRQVPLNGSTDVAAAHTLVDRLVTSGRSLLNEAESKRLLEAFGIPTAMPQLARSPQEAVELSRQIGFPLVMKVDSPQISHKTEVHGVVTGIASTADVERVFAGIVDRARRLRPEAHIDGVTLQPMLTSGEGLELIVGAKKDRVFGAVLMVGAGGVAAEVLGDRALELPPLNERLARRMLASLRIRPLLSGYRGRRAVDVDHLIELLMRFSYLIAENPCIAELDVNPLLVTPDGATALDARVVLDLELAATRPRPYTHLAIRPYPNEFVRQIALADGTPVRLRPIQPEDEPQWHQLLKNCSERSLWLRFRHVFKESTHEMATRFCFVDYDRTMPIVAEVSGLDGPQLVGVARLEADADHHVADYAVLVADACQGRGLGTRLTDFCFEIAKAWGVERISVETTAGNRPMQSILRRYQFETITSNEGDVLYQARVERPLAK